jgi:hypothetical protein
MLPALVMFAALGTPTASSARFGFALVPSEPGLPMLPTHVSASALNLRRGDWFDARVVELASVTTLRLGVESRYVNPLSLTLSRSMRVVPGLFELNGGLDLTLSAWQTTFEPGTRPEPPPLLLCSSGSVVATELGATIAQAVTLAVAAGIQDDPLHFEEGADCLGGGPVWQSSRWVSAAVTTRIAAGWRASFAVGHVERHVHDTGRGHGDGKSQSHEHVSVRGTQGVEAGAWLAADL